MVPRRRGVLNSTGRAYLIGLRASLSSGSWRGEQFVTGSKGEGQRAPGHQKPACHGIPSNWQARLWLTHVKQRGTRNELSGNPGAVQIEDGAGVRYRLRAKIPQAAMPALKALKITPPKLVERLA